MKFHFSKKWWYALAAVGAIFIIAFVAFVVSPFAKNRVPSAFNNARTQASATAQDIVTTLKGTTDSIAALQSKENQKGSDVLSVVLKSLQDTRVAREKAVILASDLEKMALAVPDIYPDSARQTAIVAISSEAALINKIISYNEELTHLLSLLQDYYSGKNITVADINSTIDRLNKNADQVNSFNRQFVSLMSKFDSYYETK